MRQRPALVALAALGISACTADSGGPLGPGAASLELAPGSNTVVVTEDDVTRQVENTPPTDDWVLYTRVGTPPTAGAFAAGPGDPPLGAGSFHSTTATGAEKVFLFNYDHVGTPLAEITDLGYATYRSAGTGQQLPSLNLQVDYNGAAPGGFTTLVFEPVYNTAQGAVVDGEWQTWDAAPAGIWWSTQPINGVCAFTCYVSWSDIVAANPDATILGGYGINQGSGNPGLVGASDALRIAYGGDSVTYDFEAYRAVTSKDECKDGGWATVTTAEGEPFRNQGQCVAYSNRA